MSDVPLPLINELLNKINKIGNRFVEDSDEDAFNDGEISGIQYSIDKFNIALRKFKSAGFYEHYEPCSNPECTSDLEYVNFEYEGKWYCFHCWFNQVFGVLDSQDNSVLKTNESVTENENSNTNNTKKG